MSPRFGAGGASDREEGLEEFEEVGAGVGGEKDDLLGFGEAGTASCFLCPFELVDLFGVKTKLEL